MTRALSIARRDTGVDYGEVTEGLESNGLAIFDASWRDLGDQLHTVLQHPEARKESGE